MKKILLIVFIAACLGKTGDSFAQATNVQDSLALIDLYANTGGPNWSETWNLANPVNTWYGVSVYNGRVTSISLGLDDFVGNNLIGNLPASLGNLSDLTLLDLEYNQLSDSLPTSLGNLSNLQELLLDNNQLTGSLPASLGNLSNLTDLDLRVNQLSGSIPAELGNLSNLTALDLGDNLLSGSIPGELGNLSNVTYLELGGNSYSGSIPAGLGNLSSVTYLGLGGSSLSGTIPGELGNLSKLTELDLSGNQFTGVSAGFFNLSNLTILWLSNNQLSGSIPAGFGNLSNLSYLIMDHNQFSGSIPAALGDLSNLTQLDLSTNQLSGSIPPALGNLSKLGSLDLDHNQLSDSIPASLGNLSNLGTLDLEYNKLSGSIPATLGNLSHSYYFYLDHNQLTGSIPAALSNLSGTAYLSLNDNKLSDSIPASMDHLGNLRELYLEDNQFTFAGMEGIVMGYPNLVTISALQYYPQAPIPINYNEGQLSVSAGGTPTNENFYWFNGSVEIAANFADSVLAITKGGSYFVIVSNSIARYLPLYSDTFKVAIIGSAANTVLAPMRTTYGTPSAAQTVAITGSGITANVIASAAPPGLEVSSDGVNYGSTATFVPSGDSVRGILYIRLAATALVGGSYNGQTIILSTGGAVKDTVTMFATGNVVNPAPLSITANNIIKCNSATYTFTGTEFTASGLKNADAVTYAALASVGAAPGAPAGNYSIVPIGVFGTGLSNYTITYIDGILTVETALVLTITQVNPDCYGDPGSLSGAVTGGITPYMYEVNSGLTYGAGPIVYGPSTTPLYSPAPPGYYTYSVTDSAGCRVIAARLSVNALTRSAVLIGSSTAPTTTEVCYGSTKTVSTIPVGGTAPYTYSLNSNGVSGPFVASANRYFSVPAGTYFITVKDNVGCIYNTDTISIVQPAAKLSFTTSISGEACNSEGIISVTAAGGFGGYSYSDNGGTSYQASDMLSGLGYGSYIVAVKDQIGCAASSTTVRLTALSSSAITASKNPICPGASTTISTTPAGGISPYTYSLDGLAYVASSKRYFNVTAGMHTIEVMDNTGCTYSPAAINITTMSCPGPLTEGGDMQKTAGTEQLFAAHVSPNPAQSAFHLQMESSSREDVELVVTNMLGVKVYEAKGGIDGTYEFGASFKSGIYILQIRQGNEVHTVKLVKGN